MTGAVAGAQERPNVLVVLADDLGYADMGVQGGAEVATPHLDRLAGSGVRCTNGYVAAPYCSPSRAALLTGRAPTRYGHEFNPHFGEEDRLGLPATERTMAEVFREAGYATGLIGKWHLGFGERYHPLERGFGGFFGFLVGAHNFLLRAGAEPRTNPMHAHDLIFRGRERQALDGYATELFSQEALAFMDRHKGEPWFLFLSYNAAHTPLEVLERHRARIPPEVTDPDRVGYLSLLLGLDEGVGGVLEGLRARGLEGNTLVIFLSDNGGAGRKPFFAYNTGRNTPLRGDKGQMLEGGIRVPFIVSWPGRLPAGRVYAEAVSALDLLPTVCALAGVAAPGGVEGVNLLPFLTGAAAGRPHEALFWRFGPQRAVRMGDWKLVDWRDFERGEQSGWELYRVSQDPGEAADLAAQFPERVAQMAEAWAAWDEENVPPLWRGSPREDPQ